MPLLPFSRAAVVLGLLVVAGAARAEGDEPAATAPAPAAESGKVTIAPTQVQVPGNGMKMSDVEARFGAPSERHEAVGEPPITRWDYPGFAVFFERDLVIHAVVVQPAA
jgi:hypothetical protein